MHRLLAVLLLAVGLGLATPAEAQYYGCSANYWGYSCYSGASSATCGQADYWGNVSCADSRGSFGWTSPSYGLNGYAYQAGSYSSLLLPSVPAGRTPSFLDTWLTGQPSSSSRYCSLLAALGC